MIKVIFKGFEKCEFGEAYKIEIDGGAVEIDGINKFLNETLYLNDNCLIKRFESEGAKREDMELNKVLFPKDENFYHNKNYSVIKQFFNACDEKNVGADVTEDFQKMENKLEEIYREYVNQYLKYNAITTPQDKSSRGDFTK